MKKEKTKITLKRDYNTTPTEQIKKDALAEEKRKKENGGRQGQPHHPEGAGPIPRNT